MGFFDVVKSTIQQSLDKKKEDKEMMDRLRKEAAMEERILFEKAFKENSLEVAKKKAYEDAAKKSGIQKLRATNRARRLTESSQADNFIGKLSAFTQKNMARRDENLKRTAELRQVAGEEKQKQDSKRFQRNQNLDNRPVSFGSRQSSWKP